MRIAITGATGFVGSAVVRRQLDAGDHIRALVRPGSRLTAALNEGVGHDQVEVVCGDLADLATTPDSSPT